MPVFDLVSKWEGFRPTAYQDSAGIWTIGYGQTTINGRPVKPGDSITEEQAKEYTTGHLNKDREYVKNYAKKYGYDWNDNQIDALTSFTYNLGRGGLNQLTANGTRDNETIAGKIGLYNKAGGKYVQGLQNRRNEELELFNKPWEAKNLAEGAGPTPTFGEGAYSMVSPVNPYGATTPGVFNIPTQPVAPAIKPASAPEPTQPAVDYEAGTVEGPRGGRFRRGPNGWEQVAGPRSFPVNDASITEWLDNRYSGGADRGKLLDAQPLTNPTIGAQELGAQQYPGQVVLDPNTTDKAEFDRMNTLVSNGMYTIQQDRAGRAIYQLTDLGNSHNVRAVGSGVTNMGYSPGVNATAGERFAEGQEAIADREAVRYQSLSTEELNDLALSGNRLAERALKRRLEQENMVYSGRGEPLGDDKGYDYSGRGDTVEQAGAREDVLKFGQSTEAPAVTPEGSKIRYQAGATYNVETKQQAQQFVAAGIVAKGAKFVLPDGTVGTAQ